MSLSAPPLLCCARQSGCTEGRRREYARPKVLLAKSIGMQAPPVDLHAQQLFEPDIAEPNPRPKVIEERELAGLGGSLERHGIEAERGGEPVCQDAAKGSGFIEEPDSLGAF